MIQLNYRDAKPIYEQIQDGLRKLIVTDSLAANDKLPSVREMAASLAINPNTIQRAYRDLESEGYIYTIAGKGSFVAGQKEVDNAREHSLFSTFDATVAELLYLSVPKRDLVERIERIERGEEIDTGKAGKEEF